MLPRTIARTARPIVAPTAACPFCEIRALFGSPIRRNAPSRRYAAPRGKPSSPRKSQFTKSREWRQRGRILTEEDKAKQAEAEAALEAAYHRGRFPEPRRLAEANSAGFLRTSPKDAHWALAKFESFGIDPATRNVRMLGESLGEALGQTEEAGLRDLTALGRICLRSLNPVQRLLGKRLLIALSNAGEASATVSLLGTALQQDRALGPTTAQEALRLPEMRKVQEQLNTIVKQGDNPQAMILKAEILYSEGDIPKAKAMFEAAISYLNKQKDAEQARMAQEEDEDVGTDAEAVPNDDIDRPLNAAWLGLGRLLLHQGDVDGAKAAFEEGAFKHNDAEAYHVLSGLEPLYSSKWVEYNTKAAAAGNALSAKYLGDFYTLSPAAVAKLEDADVKQELARQFQTSNLERWTRPFLPSLLVRLLQQVKIFYPPTAARIDYGLSWLAIAATSPPTPNGLSKLVPASITIAKTYIRHADTFAAAAAADRSPISEPGKRSRKPISGGNSASDSAETNVSLAFINPLNLLATVKGPAVGAYDRTSSLLCAYQWLNSLSLLRGNPHYERTYPDIATEVATLHAAVAAELKAAGLSDEHLASSSRFQNFRALCQWNLLWAEWQKYHAERGTPERVGTKEEFQRAADIAALLAAVFSLTLFWTLMWPEHFKARFRTRKQKKEEEEEKKREEEEKKKREGPDGGEVDRDRVWRPTLAHGFVKERWGWS
ncbi:hypothetical protein W97_03640 [Coniosporium apollinis CBS 100218]|uniref:Uncharacterized protein n=1 Tax=Coniosporium apollinis (strain CBS 100218) TaxID=1168221 RepID=R7YRH2_CONA1|nr:uncharacterized protein W97_03640 [Coniosporium apollinis CBS 100218]EON64409.1 hypothetical protein W97_03640 [Coniosporium apollinis CBS 100218]